MRILALNHSALRELGAKGEKRIVGLLRSYASPGTIVQLDYPEDLGGSGAASHPQRQSACGVAPYLDFLNPWTQNLNLDKFQII